MCVFRADIGGARNACGLFITIVAVLISGKLPKVLTRVLKRTKTTQPFPLNDACCLRRKTHVSKIKMKTDEWQARESMGGAIRLSWGLAVTSAYLLGDDAATESP